MNFFPKSYSAVSTLLARSQYYSDVLDASVDGGNYGQAQLRTTHLEEATKENGGSH